MGRKNGRVAASAVKTRNSPLLVTCEMNAGPPPPPPPPPGEPSPVSIRTAMPTRTGTAASTPSRARVRQRRNVVSSSLRSRPRLHSGFAFRTVSARDIEPLPGQCHERVLQRGPFDPEAADPDARGDQGRVHLGEVALRYLAGHPVLR